MSVNSKMTTVADEIRELSGTTGTMGLDAMATYVNEANSEINTQASLIAQIQSAVDGLPEAGNGDSEEKVIETCTVTFSSTNSSYANIVIFQYIDLDSTGAVVGKTLISGDITSPISIQCVCNTNISGLFPPTNISKIDFVNCKNEGNINSSSGTLCWLRLTAPADGTATITFN